MTRDRIYCLAAAALTAASLALPLWGFRMTAPQYPDEPLQLRVTRHGIEGDVQEVETLQHYIGVRFPEQLPELPQAQAAIGGLTLLLLLAAAVGGRGAWWLRRLVFALYVAFLLASAATVQLRLYETGHTRDPDAPIRAMRNFTPPLVGPVKVGNFTVWSFPHAGAIALLAAAGLAFMAARTIESTRASRRTGAGVMRAAALAVALTTPAVTDARTWTVGGAGADFPLIAPAIRAAAPRDVIQVGAGVYRENLVIDKALRIVGPGRSGGSDAILIGPGVGTVVVIAAPSSELSGFTIEGSGTGLSNAMDAAVLVAARGVRVSDNRMRRVFYGVVVSGAADAEVTGNVIEGLADLPFGRRGDGVYVYRSPRALVARNTISGERDAIYFQYSPLGRVAGNRVRGSRYGLHDMFSDDTRIEDNVFSHSSVGANIMNSRGIRIERNAFLHNRGVPGVGLTLKDCDDAAIAGNRLAANARALLVDGSSSNRFIGNSLRDNDTAVVLFSSAEGNRFTGNEFLDNWSDLVLSGRDSGTTWSGNYWSRYRGFDFDGDGDGEAPHPLLGAFERIEGANPAARIFLRSPAALGLELAARLGAAPPGDAIDPAPRVRPIPWDPALAGLGATPRDSASAGVGIAGYATTPWDPALAGLRRAGFALAGLLALIAVSASRVVSVVSPHVVSAFRRTCSVRPAARPGECAPCSR